MFALFHITRENKEERLQRCTSSSELITISEACRKQVLQSPYQHRDLFRLCKETEIMPRQHRSKLLMCKQMIHYVFNVNYTQLEPAVVLSWRTLNTFPNEGDVARVCVLCVFECYCFSALYSEM